MKEYKVIPFTGKTTVGEVNDEIAALKNEGWEKTYDLLVVMEREIPEPPVEPQSGLTPADDARVAGYEPGNLS